MWPRVDGLRAMELGASGELSARLTELALSGAKVATAGLWRHDYLEQGEELEVVGEEQVLVHEGRVVARLRITRIERYGFTDVPWEFAEAEGEGFVSIDDWRAGHQRFWEQSGVSVADDELVVCVWFEVTERSTT